MNAVHKLVTNYEHSFMTSETVVSSSKQTLNLIQYYNVSFLMKQNNENLSIMINKYRSGTEFCPPSSISGSKTRYLFFSCLDLVTLVRSFSPRYYGNKMSIDVASPSSSLTGASPRRRTTEMLPRVLVQTVTSSCSGALLKGS